MTDSTKPASPPSADRNSRAEALRNDVQSVAVPERLAAGEAKLRTAGLVLPLIGLLLIALAWYQASGTAFVAEQIPFLISGGLAGLGILTIGVGLYVRFSLASLLRFWLARLVAEHQVQTDRVVESLARIEAGLAAQQNGSVPPTGSARSDRPVASASTVDNKP